MGQNEYCMRSFYSSCQSTIRVLVIFSQTEKSDWFLASWTQGLKCGKSSMVALRNLKPLLRHVAALDHHRYWSLSLLVALSLFLSLIVSVPPRLSPQQRRHSLFTMDGIKTALYRGILRGPIWLRVQCSYRGMSYAVFSNRNTNPPRFFTRERLGR